MAVPGDPQESECCAVVEAVPGDCQLLTLLLKSKSITHAWAGALSPVAALLAGFPLLVRECVSIGLLPCPLTHLHVL